MHRQDSTSTIGLCWWLLHYAARRWGSLLAVLAAMLLGAGLNVLKPWPTKILIDHVLADKPIAAGLARGLALLPGTATQEGLLVWCLAGIVVLFLLGWALGLAASLANISFGLRMIYDLAGDLFGHLQRLSLRFHSRLSVGDSIRRVTTDCTCVSTIVRDALLPVVSSVFSLVAMFAIMWRMDSALTLLSLAVVPFMVLVFHRYAEPMLRRSCHQQEVEGQLYDITEQTLSSVPIVQAFAREDHGDRRFRANTDEILDATLSTTHVQLQFKILMNLTTAVGTAGILWIGAHHALTGRITVGDILVFLTYLGSLYTPLNSLMYTSSTIQGAAGSARRVLEVLTAEPEVAERPDAPALPPVRGHLRFEAVGFGYEPGRPVLHDVWLEALPGQSLAVVGPTGAGKSTLVSLVPRLFDPWSGRVLIDGHDVRDVRLRSLRDQVALVLQEPFLFPTTVAENIAYGRPGATRAEVEAAARAANAEEFIARLPGGYDAVLGPRGATLSGGERQRLAIARAILKDAPILILDEPTSALDAAAEELVLEAVGRLMRGRTTLVIAHRLSTVRRADRIVVVEGGRVVEAGTHQELLAARGLYHRLHHLQCESVAADAAV